MRIRPRALGHASALLTSICKVASQLAMPFAAYAARVGDAPGGFRDTNCVLDLRLQSARLRLRLSA
eukprot:1016674-Alexandrium_andersonii.AAC.1